MSTTDQPTLDQINGEFPDALVFTADNGNFYARPIGISVIAAAPTTGELRDQRYMGTRDLYQGAGFVTCPWPAAAARACAGRHPLGRAGPGGTRG
jgi:hypothetical protein